MPQFAHPAEEEFARLLDFYGVPWLYEPRMFPLSTRPDGSLESAFSPDFYLPLADLYIELTTTAPRQIARKNRKIRLLRAHYPEIRIRLFDRKHIHNLFLRYGIPFNRASRRPTFLSGRLSHDDASLSPGA